MKHITIGICGLGTIGGGVVEILSTQQEKLKNNGYDISIKKVCDLDTSLEKTLPIPAETEFVTDLDSVLNDPEIDLIVELIGGVGIAKKVVYDALSTGKLVVTANKALLAQHLKEITQLLEQNPSSKICCEAAIGGGIPIINNLQTHFLSDTITSITGIVNGTTNYMLSHMAQNGSSYQDILQEAQNLGYAEADPTADIAGHDARSKILLLSQFARGASTDQKNIFCQGIQHITQQDFQCAQASGYTIKLIAHASKQNNNISMYVAPAWVPLQGTLGSTNGATNIIEINSQQLIHTTLIGEGAGRYPTATAVVADIVNIANERSIKFHINKEITYVDVLSGKFVLCFKAAKELDFSYISHYCAQHDVIIKCSLEAPHADTYNYFAVKTQNTKLSNIQSLLEKITYQSDYIENIHSFFLYDQAS